jgi:nicotinamide-nucleotide amidase
MQSEIITIGDELLIGQTVDTNSAWMAKKLNAIGVSVFQITSVSDDVDHILSALRDASERSDLVLITGGLGPTKDDITKQTLCKYFDTHLVMHHDVRERIEAYFASRGLPALEVNKKQAEMPANATVVPNAKGTAQGMWFEKEGTVYVSMPGVPYEMQCIMEDHLLELIQKRFKRPHIEHYTIQTSGIGESMLAALVEDWENSLGAEGISLAYLPSPGIVKLRLTSIGEDKKAIQEKVQRKAEEFKHLAAKYIFGEGDDQIEEVVGKLLEQKEMTVSTAESCTGGTIASSITKRPGSSAYFIGSIVAYNDDVKINLLGVQAETLQKCGAVSAETVIEMAEGARKSLNTTFSVATSGIAGPDGGTQTKPVGLIYVAVSGPQGTVVEELKFSSDRDRNILRTTRSALSLLRIEILRCQAL